MVDSLIVFGGSIYIFIGIIFLFVPLLYLELGKPKDLIKAFLNLIVGLIAIIKHKMINELYFVIFLLLTALNILYLIELFLSRWNQLTDKEKDKLTTFLEFKNNLSKTLEAFKLGVMNLTKLLNFFKFDRDKQKINPKKWVRNDKNDNIKV